MQQSRLSGLRYLMISGFFASICMQHVFSAPFCLSSSDYEDLESGDESEDDTWGPLQPLLDILRAPFISSQPNDMCSVGINNSTNPESVHRSTDNGTPAIPSSFLRKSRQFYERLHLPHRMTLGNVITIRRSHILADSFAQLRRIDKAESLKGELTVEFDGEEGVDNGGLVKEWFQLLSKEMFNPRIGLFEYCNEFTFGMDYMTSHKKITQVTKNKPEKAKMKHKTIRTQEQDTMNRVKKLKEDEPVKNQNVEDKPKTQGNKSKNGQQQLVKKQNVPYKIEMRVRRRNRKLTYEKQAEIRKKKLYQNVTFNTNLTFEYRKRHLKGKPVYSTNFVSHTKKYKKPPFWNYAKDYEPYNLWWEADFIKNPYEVVPDDENDETSANNSISTDTNHSSEK